MAVTSAVLSAVAWTARSRSGTSPSARFVNGCGWATDNPLRRMMMGEAVGRDRMATAMALDVGASNASRMVGPTVGGLLLAGIGIEGAFLLGALLYATAIAATLAVRTRIAALARRRRRARPAPGRRIAIVFADKRLAATMVVTVIYNVFAWPFTSMIPVIGRDRLLLGPEGVGILTSFDGVGAFVGALVLALWLTPGWHARAYVGGVAVYLLGADRASRSRPTPVWPAPPCC